MNVGSTYWYSQDLFSWGCDGCFTRGLHRSRGGGLSVNARSTQPILHGFGVWGLGSGVGVWDLGSGVWSLGFGVWGLGSVVWGQEFGVWGPGFGVGGLGFGVWGVHVKVPLRPPWEARACLLWGRGVVLECWEYVQVLSRDLQGGV